MKIENLTDPSTIITFHKDRSIQIFHRPALLLSPNWIWGGFGSGFKAALVAKSGAALGPLWGR